ncbi:MAG: manganese efflux pump MntP family protein [Paraprevotella sp.]|nr:manganese efflux pump MntP family protein [Paraprevotella sp.]
MHITEAILLGLALAMDCFTVSITSGTIAKHIVARSMLTMILLFGLFQGGMVLIGWYVSTLFSHYLAPVDHWIAFGLLAFVGVQMIREGFKKEEKQTFNPLSYKMIITLSFATSIDAMAVGVSMAFMQLHTWYAVPVPVTIIAVITSLLTTCGLGAGIFIGRKIPFSTSPIGGLILIGIGIKILIEHLGLFS